MSVGAADRLVVREHVPGVSVITLNKNRRAPLLQLIEGLERGPRPSECVVVQMGETEPALPGSDLTIREVALPGDGLPLAAARNLGRRAARGEILVFLDVDCIPSGDLVPALASAVRAHDGLVCCPVRYLTADAVRDGWTEHDLDQLSVPHPARAFPRAGVAWAEHPGLFWSLAFGVRAATFDRLGGFDEGYEGYGAEDTDLAFRAAEADVPVLLCSDGHAYHQHHVACDPPLQHFADIVRNAQRFRTRHGTWPMPGWLDAFAGLGLIEQDRSERLTILRAPTPDEITAARLPPERPF